MPDQWFQPDQTGDDYMVPAGWATDDMEDAASQMSAFLNSKAFYLYAHRIGHEQRHQAQKAIPVNPASTSHESKIAAGANYRTFEKVLTIMTEIASHRRIEDEDQ